jgi:hypothetical protein
MTIIKSIYQWHSCFLVAHDFPARGNRHKGTRTTQTYSAGSHELFTSWRAL